MNALNALPPDTARSRVLGTKAAAAFVDLSVPTLRRLRALNTIPAPIQLSERRIGWRIGDLTDWVDARAKGLAWSAVLAARAQNDNHSCSF